MHKACVQGSVEGQSALLTFLSWGSQITAGLWRSLGVLPLTSWFLGLLLKGKAFCSSLGMCSGLKWRFCLTTG